MSIVGDAKIPIERMHMEAKRLDGRAISRDMREGIAREVADLQGKGVVPGLGVLLVGDEGVIVLGNQGPSICFSEGAGLMGTGASTHEHESDWKDDSAAIGAQKAILVSGA